MAVATEITGVATESTGVVTEFTEYTEIITAKAQSNRLPHHCGTTRSDSDHAAARWKPAAVRARSKMQHPGTAGAYLVYPAAGIMDHGSLVIEVPSPSPL